MTQNKSKILVIESEGKMTLCTCHSLPAKSEHFIETFVTITTFVTYSITSNDNMHYTLINNGSECHHSVQIHCILLK